MDIDLQPFGKWLVLAGIIVSAVGLIVLIGGRIGLFHLPGDLQFGSRHWRIYFPLATSLLISLILTLILWLIRLFK